VDLKDWFGDSPALTGYCRVCKRPWANVSGLDGEFPDDMLEEWEVLNGLQPVRMIGGGRVEVVLGEWCSVACLRVDIQRLGSAVFRDVGS